MKTDFAENVRLLQNYPIDDIQIVLTTAYSVRDMRLNALAAGQVVPGINDKRSSGLFSSDWSDTSSINSSGSGTRLQRLRETTDIARASFDSFRKESKESLDELFRRTTSPNNEPWKRASTGEVARSLSQRLALKVRRQHSLHQPSQDTGLYRSNSVRSEQTHHTRSNSLLNRFSQMVTNNSNAAVSPFKSSSSALAAAAAAATPAQDPTFRNYRGFV